MADRVPDYDPSILPTTQIGARGRQVFAQGAGVASVNRGEFGAVTSTGGREYGELQTRIDRLVTFELEREKERAQLEGAEEGARAGELPGFKPKEEMTVRAQAYNKAGLATATHRLDHDARVALSGFEQQYDGDPAGFKLAVEGYRAGVVKTLPPQLSTSFANHFDLLSLPSLNRVRNEGEKQQIDRAVAAWEAGKPQLKSSIQRNARSSAGDPAAALAVRMDLTNAQNDIVRYGPKYAFELNGTQYPADPTRLGAFSVVKMTEELGKLRAEADENQVLSYYDQGPKTPEYIEDWRKRELSPQGSGLTEEQVTRLANQMYADVARREHGQAAQRGALVEETRDHYASLENTGEGKPGVTYDRVLSLWGKEKADEFARDEKLARDTYTAGEILRYANPQQAFLTLENFKPEPGSENYAERIVRYEKLRARYDKMRQDFQNDPAKYVAAAPGVTNRETSFEAQRQLGIVPGGEWLLTKGEAEGRVQLYLNAKPEARADLMEGWKKAAGKDWAYVYRDLVRSKLPDEARVLATVTNPVARVKLAEAYGVGAKVLKESLDPKDVTAANKTIREELKELNATLNYSHDGAKVGAIYQQAVEALTYSYMKGGMEAEKAAKRAANEIVNDDYDYRPTFRAPKGRGDATDLYAGQLKLSLKPDELVLPPRRASDQFASEEIRRQAYWTGVQAGYFVTNPDDTGVLLVDQDNQPVKRRRIDPKTGAAKEEQVGFLYDDIVNLPVARSEIAGEMPLAEVPPVEVIQPPAPAAPMPAARPTEKTPPPERETPLGQKIQEAIGLQPRRGAPPPAPGKLKEPPPEREQKASLEGAIGQFFKDEWQRAGLPKFDFGGRNAARAAAAKGEPEKIAEQATNQIRQVMQQTPTTTGEPVSEGVVSETAGRIREFIVGQIKGMTLPKFDFGGRVAAKAKETEQAPAAQPAAEPAAPAAQQAIEQAVGRIRDFVQDEFKRAGLPKFDFGGRAAAKAKEEPASREVPLEAKIGETIARTLKPPGEGGASGTPERGRDYAVPPGERGAGGVPERGRDYTGPPGERGAGGVPERKRRSLTKDDQVSMSPGGIPRDLEDFITKTEKFRATPYDDFKQRSFGYGTDARGRSSISEPEARQEMRAELARHAQGIDRLNPNLPDGVKKALVSLAYNVGAWYRKPATNDDGSPSLRGLIERGELAAAREKFLQFDKAGGAVNRGLQKRRRDELAEFWPQNTSIARK